MNYFKYLEERIGEIVPENKCEFILYPFGERGGLAKGILNAIYGIQEKAIIDNLLCDKYDHIYSLEDLAKMDLSNCKVLITSDNEMIYEELRERLYSVVPEEKCIELLPTPWMVAAKRAIPVAAEKMLREGLMNPYYHPRKTHSDFYLPFLPMDSIQRCLLLSDDYFDRRNLDRVLKYYDDGIVGDKISKGEGVILDIGANIGNHTLFFCNEYNAKKVYCFEPVEKTFAILEENIRLNHLEKRVVLNKCGLGEREERRSVYQYDLMNIGGTGLKEDRNGNLEIRCLDGIEIEEPVVLMKIDVEGMEVKVLRGGLELIKRNLPYIMIESDENRFPETKEILCNLGYRYEQLGVMDWFFYQA